MRLTEALIIGRKGDSTKVIGDVQLFDTALNNIMQYNDDPSLFKNTDEVQLVVVQHDSRYPIINRRVVEARQKKNAEAAEQEAVRKPPRGKLAAVAASVFFLICFTAVAQMDIAPALYTKSLVQTNTADSGVQQWRPDDILTLQSYVVTTYDVVADTNDITGIIDESLDGDYWLEATKTVSMLTTNTTNGTVTLFKMTNDLGTTKWRFSAFEKAGAATNTYQILSLTVLRADD